MANRYWVGGTGNWSDTAHWSASSGGSGGETVPTSTDDVFVDSNSGSGTLTINEHSSCLNFDATSGGMTLSKSSSFVLTVHGGFEIGESMVVSSFGGDMQFSGVGVHDIHFGNNEYPILRYILFGGASGTFNFTSGLNAPDATIEMATSGVPTFNFNSYIYNIYSRSLSPPLYTSVLSVLSLLLCLSLYILLVGLQCYR